MHVSDIVMEHSCEQFSPVKPFEARCLLSAGADLARRNADGGSALHVAAARHVRGGFSSSLCQRVRHPNESAWHMGGVEEACTATLLRLGRETLSS